jgi:hypothetical protein
MKVYFSRSKAAHPDLISNIRFLLKKNGVQILEYDGGPYNEDYIKAKNPDFVIVLPPMVSKEELDLHGLKEDQFTLGKGVDAESEKIPHTYYIVPGDPEEEVVRNQIKVIHKDDTNKHEFTRDVQEARVYWSYVTMKKEPFNLVDLLASNTPQHIGNASHQKPNPSRQEPDEFEDLFK